MIVPRWEWRTFGEHFGAAEDRLAELTPTSVEDSDELYIVSSRGEGSIKSVTVCWTSSGSSR
jgi:exopolyphosphatase / guanosine-5'-triphosphate,3'-diphosphate pyrophosphatase